MPIASSKMKAVSTAENLAREQSENPAREQRLRDLRELLQQLERVVVAFSGGVDSALLAWLAKDTLGSKAMAVTAVSPSLASVERQHCQELARQWGLRWLEVFTQEQKDERYLRNDTQRCAYCREFLMEAVKPIAQAEQAEILLGITLDDLGDHRPGIEASRQRGALFPFVEAGIAKAEVRSISRELGLPTWSKPASPCLASRVPYGTPVSVEVLSKVERAEAVLSQLGFCERRVRHYGDIARIEIPADQLSALLAVREQIIQAFKAVGYRYATVDLEGLRSGNLNPQPPTQPPERPSDPSEMPHE